MKSKKSIQGNNVYSAPKNSDDSLTRKLINITNTLIKPEERTIKNYVNPSFWQSKYNEYKKTREKEKEDLNIYETLSYGARPTVEYYMLTILSCLIATAGLLQGSTAVIIGAMIVAPFMTPILAFSLGVIWGDSKLIKTSFGSIMKGTIIAILISGILAFVVPIAEYNAEILARTKPSLFDIVVAISSGLVGAYGNANKKISNSLVGIAIAVALMPPLCTIGIGVGNFDWDIAQGAMILFSINLISISLSGAFIFWIMKIHPKTHNEQEVARRALSQIIISSVLLVIIAVPVSIYTYRTFKIEQIKKTVWEISRTTFNDELFNITFHETQSQMDVIITIFAKEPDQEAIKTVKTNIHGLGKHIANIKFKFIQVVHEGTFTE